MPLLSVFRCALVLPLLALLAPPAVAADPLQDAMRATLRIETRTAGDARSAATLGRSRQGTAMAIDSAGLALTIGFLITEATEVTLRGADGKAVPAKVVAWHSETGFGLVRALAPIDAVPIRLGNSGAVAAGQPMAVLSNYEGQAAAPALVVARKPFTGAWEYMIEGAIFTAPPVAAHPGAGLVGEDGRLVGIGYLLMSGIPGEVAGLPGNMFVPIDLLKPILGDLIAEGRTPQPRRPWLGLYAQEIGGRLLVERVAEGGPAARAGVGRGDIVLQANGEAVTTLAELYRRVWALGDAGAEVPLTVLQGARLRDVTVRSMDRYDWQRRDRGL